MFSCNRPQSKKARLSMALLLCLSNGHSAVRLRFEYGKNPRSSPCVAEDSSFQLALFRIQGPVHPSRLGRSLRQIEGSRPQGFLSSRPRGKSDDWDVGWFIRSGGGNTIFPRSRFDNHDPWAPCFLKRLHLRGREGRERRIRAQRRLQQRLPPRRFFLDFVWGRLPHRMELHFLGR